MRAQGLMTRNVIAPSMITNGPVERSVEVCIADGCGTRPKVTAAGESLTAHLQAPRVPNGSQLRSLR
jgi:hypothetical protein